MSSEESYKYAEEVSGIVFEGEETVKEIQFGVKHAEMSRKHNTGNQEHIVYMNITSKEGDSYCVELSASGYRIVGRQYDNISGEDSTKYYETIYAFLDDVSPLYRASFSDALTEKLKKLEDMQKNNSGAYEDNFDL